MKSYVPISRLALPSHQQMNTSLCPPPFLTTTMFATHFGHSLLFSFPPRSHTLSSMVNVSGPSPLNGPTSLSPLTAHDWPLSSCTAIAEDSSELLDTSKRWLCSLQRLAQYPCPFPCSSFTYNARYRECYRALCDEHADGTCCADGGWSSLSRTAMAPRKLWSPSPELRINDIHHDGHA